MKSLNEYFNNMINTVARRRLFINAENIYFNIKDAINNYPRIYHRGWKTLVTPAQFMEFIK